MKFKEPRDKNTDPHLLKLRDVSLSENVQCEVGRGECKNLAVECHDDGCGGPFFLCAQHVEEFIALSKLIYEMTPNQISNFALAMEKAERSTEC